MSRQKTPGPVAPAGQAVRNAGPGDERQINSVVDRCAYERQFASVQDEKAVGEVSSWRLYMKDAAPAIRKALPEVKLVAILRDPVERAYANYLHAVHDGVEPLPTFREAMQAEASRIRDNWSPVFHYKSKGFYYQQLQHYNRFFDRSRIKIYLYEDLMNEPEAMFADLFEYLGVDPMLHLDADDCQKTARAAAVSAISQLMESEAGTRGVRKRTMPLPWRRRSGGNSTLNGSPKPRLARKDRREFIETYREDILKLEEYLGCDLSNWLK